MQLYDVITIILATVSLIISIISLVKSNQANKVAQGEIEISINQMINQTKKDILDITLTIAEASDNKNILNHALKLARESNLNAYEEACAKYLDNKVDKERFKRNYSIEIRQLVENENYKRYFDANTSPYKCILKVYNDWNNLEA